MWSKCVFSGFLLVNEIPGHGESNFLRFPGKFACPIFHQYSPFIPFITGLNLYRPTLSLPFRYLGVPLISSKLRKVDCLALVEKMTSRVKSWTCRFLSYAGRAQLVKTILFAIQVYWSSLFILLQGVIKSIEQIWISFLWKDDDVSKGGGKVAWETLCLPRKEGGLGIKRIGAWNQAAMTKHTHLAPLLRFGSVCLVELG